MTINIRIVMVAALDVIIGAHLLIAILTPQKWVLLPALVYTIAALAMVCGMRDD